MTRIQIKVPKNKKYYPIKNSNNLAELKKWLVWEKTEHPNEKFIIVNNYKRYMKDKKHKEYWKDCIKRGYEHKYSVYGDFKLILSTY